MNSWDDKNCLFCASKKARRRDAHCRPLGQGNWVAIRRAQALHDGYEVYVGKMPAGDVSRLLNDKTMKRVIKPGKAVTSVGPARMAARLANKGTYDAVDGYREEPLRS